VSLFWQEWCRLAHQQVDCIPEVDVIITHVLFSCTADVLSQWGPLAVLVRAWSTVDMGFKGTLSQ